MTNRKPQGMPEPLPNGMRMMGKPIPFAAMQVGHDHCIAMGLSSDKAYLCVKAVAEQLSRDKPYEAMAEGMKFLDLTGTYRLFAALLCAAAARAVKKPVLPRRGVRAGLHMARPS